MTQTKTALFAIAILVVAIGGVLLFTEVRSRPVPALDATQAASSTDQGQTQAVETGRAMSIEQYVTSNISELSPVKEQLGGKFYVTSIAAADGAGTVHYEDGHNGYVADFTYTTDPEHGAITIKSFVVRP